MHPLDRTHRIRGVTAVGIVAIIAVLVVAGGAAAYFLSDVQRTKMDRAYTSFAEWTPENIAKDPAGYLDFAEAETEKALTKLEASKIGVAQQRGRLEGLKDESAAAVKVGTSTLDQLKVLYKEADAKGDAGFPVEWEDQKRDRQFLRRQIVSLDKQVTSRQALLEQVTAALKTLDAEQVRVSDLRDAARQQLVEITNNREILKVQAISDSLKQQLVDLKAVIQTTVSAAGQSPDAVVSLDDLSAKAETVADDSQFDAIMSR